MYANLHFLKCAVDIYDILKYFLFEYGTQLPVMSLNKKIGMIFF